MRGRTVAAFPKHNAYRLVNLSPTAAKGYRRWWVLASGLLSPRQVESSLEAEGQQVDRHKEILPCRIE